MCDLVRYTIYLKDPRKKNPIISFVDAKKAFHKIKI